MRISFYKKMTIKPQNNAMYGRNISINFLHLYGRLAPQPGQNAFLRGAKRPLSHKQRLLSPVLKKLVLESNEEFCNYFIFYIRNNKVRVAQNIRVKTPSGMGQDAHCSILPIKHYGRLAPQGCQ